MRAAPWIDGVHTRIARGGRATRNVYAGVRAIARMRQVLARRARVRSLEAPAGALIPEGDGHRVLPAWSLPSIQPVVRAGRALRAATDTAPLWEESEGRNLLRVSLEPRFEREPEWLDLALDPSLLAIVSRYLGSVPLLTVAQLWISPFALYAPDGRRLENRYHCDWASIRQVRALVFVEDVTMDHGPLTVLPAARSAEIRAAMRYTFEESACALVDDALFAHASPMEARGLCGPAGTLAFADTSRCFHQGSRVRREGLERVMVMFQYMPVTAFKLPDRFTRRCPFAGLVRPEHDDLQRMVLGAA